MRLAKWLRLSAPILVLVAGSRCDLIEDKVMHRTPGEKLFNRLCSECHGENGRGNTPRGIGNPSADLIDDNWKYGGDRGSIERVISEGVFGEMPAHPELKPVEVRAIVDHLMKMRRANRGPS